MCKQPIWKHSQCANSQSENIVCKQPIWKHSQCAAGLKTQPVCKQPVWKHSQCANTSRPCTVVPSIFMPQKYFFASDFSSLRYRCVDPLKKSRLCARGIMYTHALLFMTSRTQRPETLFLWLLNIIFQQIRLQIYYWKNMFKDCCVYFLFRFYQYVWCGNVLCLNLIHGIWHWLVLKLHLMW